MPARLNRVTLPVSAIERATTFYGRLLHQPGRRTAPDVHEFQCGGVVLVCREMPGATPHTAPTGFAVPDLENHRGRASTSGCRAIGAIESQPSGVRGFQVEDPFGNLLSFEEE
jgi:predicted enzyme related to lactoylglutathione lyase